MIRPFKILVLAAVFAREFSVSVYRVVRLVLSPKMHFSPRAFLYPLSVKSDLEITLLANMITLTPGTLTIDVTPDRSALIVHAVDCPDVEAARRDIANSLERRVREAFS